MRMRIWNIRNCCANFWQCLTRATVGVCSKRKACHKSMRSLVNGEKFACSFCVFVALSPSTRQDKLPEKKLSRHLRPTPRRFVGQDIRAPLAGYVPLFEQLEKHRILSRQAQSKKAWFRIIHSMERLFSKVCFCKITAIPQLCLAGLSRATPVSRFF